MNFDRLTLDRIYRYCVAICGQPDSAWDLLQEAVEQYLGAAPEGVHDPVAYTCRIARNRLIDQQRRAGVVAFESLGDPELYRSTEPDLEQTMIDRDTLHRLWARLTPPEREALYLWGAEGMSAAEIARHLDQPRPTILSRLKRARQRIIELESSPQRHGGRT